MNLMMYDWTDKSLLMKRNILKFLNQYKDKVNFQQGSINVKNNDHYRYWEYASALSFSDWENKKVLDAGGANSLLSWYMAQNGATVISTDMLQKDVNRGVENNKKVFKIPNIQFVQQDMSDMTYEEEFDCVYSICVVEHIMEHARAKVDKSFRPGHSHYWNKQYSYKPTQYEIEKEQKCISNMSRALKQGGMLIISYEYRRQFKCAHYRNHEDVMERIVKPTGLKLVKDFDISDAPSNNVGILFLRK